MLFKPALIEKILTGEKTQTRRPWNPGEYIQTNLRADGALIDCVKRYNGYTERLLWEVERLYAIQPRRGAPGIPTHRIKILSLESSYVHFITSSDARAEGFAGRAEFLAAWASMYGPKATEAAVWVIKFCVVKTGKE